MHLDNKIEFGMRKTDKDDILLEDESKKLVIADEEIKKNVAYNNYAFQQNFPNIMSYLKKNEIFTAALLVNKQFAKFTRSIDFWLKIYLSRPDMKNYFFSNQSGNYLDKLACLLYDAIKADFFDLLFDADYQKTWNLEIFFSLKAWIISSLVLEKTQLSLKLTYLLKAKAKKKGIEEKVKCKLEELKDYGFGYLQFPNDELQTIGSIGDEKNKTKLIVREEKFSEFFNIFKNAINHNLEIYKEKFVKAKLDYLKFYFKILFWDSESSKLDIGSKEFYQLILAPIPRYEIDMDDGSDCGKNNDLKLYYSPSGRKKINGLGLAVEMGNLHVLEACSKTIQSYLNLGHVFKAKFPETEIDNFPEKLLAIAAETGQEAVMQFLFDQGVRPESDSTSRYHYYPAIYRAISQNRHGPAMLLVAQGAGVHVIPPDGRTPLCQLKFRPFKILGLLILYAGNVSIDNEFHKTTLLTIAAKSSWQYLKMQGSKDKSEIEVDGKSIENLSGIINAEPKKGKDEIAETVAGSIKVFRGLKRVSNFDKLDFESQDRNNLYSLEAIRLLLMLGADPAKVNDEDAKQVIYHMMPIITDQESLTAENKERGEDKLISPPPQKITYIRDFSFIKEQKKEDKSTNTTSIISTSPS